MINCTLSPVIQFSYTHLIIHMKKVNVYTRTGSIMTWYTVASDPVLIYTINYSCTRLPGRKIKCVHGCPDDRRQATVHIILGRVSVTVTSFS